jgi:hypothetical protein
MRAPEHAATKLRETAAHAAALVGQAGKRGLRLAIAALEHARVLGLQGTLGLRERRQRKQQRCNDEAEQEWHWGGPVWLAVDAMQRMVPPAAATRMPLRRASSRATAGSACHLARTQEQLQPESTTAPAAPL